MLLFPEHSNIIGRINFALSAHRGHRDELVDVN